jgi:multidrug resistance efflux pump
VPNLTLCRTLLAVLLAAGGAIAQAQAPGGPAQAEKEKVVAAAPGRVEGSAAAVDVGASVSGIVEKVAVRQGDRVAAGQLLVHIACDDIAARLETQRAEYEAAVAFHRKLVDGPRPEEIDIAQSEVKLAEARLAETELRLTRSRSLVGDAISRAAYDAAERDMRMAAAQLDVSRSRLRLLQAGTREEELTEAIARMLAARDAVLATQAELAKYDIRSPVDGIVLRKYVSKGELVSLFFPKPLITVVELRNYRVRAEVDEHDVPHVRLGQNADVVVSADAPRRIRGHVVRLAPVMGRRQILTSDPADKSDRDVMEVLVEVDEMPETLPIGLRVSVLFLQ